MNVAVNKMINSIELENTERPLVVIGDGPVGMAVAQAIIRRKHDQQVVIFGGEPWKPYNRVKLSHFLAGEMNATDIETKVDWMTVENVIHKLNCPIARIDRKNKCVIDGYAGKQNYSKLIIATGSTPHIPNIKGVELSGVYTFRNRNDADLLLKRQGSGHRVVVIGGGLLGIEAARAMHKNGAEVIIVEHATRLMMNQLDTDAAQMLKKQVNGLGIEVILQDSVSEIVGSEYVTGIELRHGEFVECDTVILSAGIRPNIGLARESGLAIGRGIKVNDQMQTRDPDIYAVGECAEHRDKVYGFVAPGLEQAEVAAHSMLGGESSYQGSINATRLKVLDFPVFSAGVVDQESTARTIRESVFQQDNTCYRKLVLENGKLIGLVALGEWEGFSRAQTAVIKNKRLWPWQLMRFRKSGELWAEENDTSISQWPASTTICQCKNVCHGEITEKINAGCSTLTEIKDSTGASSVCGSCQPLIAKLLGGNVKKEKAAGASILLILSVISLLTFTGFAMSGALTYSSTVNVAVAWDTLWRDGLYKQISGFTLLGLSLVGLLLSLRKRLAQFSFADFYLWRIVHVVTGVLILVTLVAHNGLRFGYQLDFYLMLFFVGLLVLGAVSAMVIALEHRLSTALASGLRKTMLWGHILLSWPVPALLSFHVLKVYYF